MGGFSRYAGIWWQDAGIRGRNDETLRFQFSKVAGRTRVICRVLRFKLDSLRSAAAVTPYLGESFSFA